MAGVPRAVEMRTLGVPGGCGGLGCRISFHAMGEGAGRRRIVGAEVAADRVGMYNRPAFSPPVKRLQSRMTEGS